MESLHNTTTVKKFKFLLWISWTENKKVCCQPPAMFCLYTSSQNSNLDSHLQYCEVDSLSPFKSRVTVGTYVLVSTYFLKIWRTFYYIPTRFYERECTRVARPSARAHFTYRPCGLPRLLKMTKWSKSRISLQRQVWIVNYYVKSLSNNLSNENIKTGVSREMIFEK